MLQVDKGVKEELQELNRELWLRPVVRRMEVHAPSPWTPPPSVEAVGEGRILSGLTVDLAAGFNFLFRNSALCILPEGRWG